MARAITREQDLPPFAQPYAARISLLGFGWRFIKEHRLLDTSKRVQVRDIAAVAPQREVAKYATALKRGDQMPPVVVTADGYLVDGATRTEAARRVGWRTFPAFQLEVNAEDAPEAVMRQLVILGSAFNLTHGRGMNSGNVTKLIEAVSDDDDSPKDIARKLHISEATATTAMNAAKARRRIDKLGIDLNGALTNTHLKMLGQKSAKLTSPVFAELVILTQDARLTLSGLSDLCKRLEGTETERERLQLLAAERESYRDVIEGGAVNPSRAAKLRRSLGFLNGQDPEMLVELEPRASRDHIRALLEAAEKLQKVLSAQEQVEVARSVKE